MNLPLDIRFASLSASPSSTAVLFTGPDLALASSARNFDQASGGFLTRAASAADFKGRPKQSVEVLAAPKLECGRVLMLGVSPEMDELAHVNLGGRALGAIKARSCETASVFADLPDLSAAASAAFAALLAEGALLRNYEFRRYRSNVRDDAKGGDEGGNNGNGKSSNLKTLVVHTARPEQAAELFAARRAVAEGVMLARDLVNEPANILGPVEFADRVAALSKSGLDIEVLDVAALEKLKMGALLGVAMGSVRPARVAIMQWHGAKSKRAKPLCFVGKGVVFDTGGISMKPAAGMEDMKGDMGGAACVTGLMLALAGRKAPVNAIGLVGLVENMPSGNAQRPGDIVTSMSGQTIEVLNTDAEGRLVLADVLTYAQERFKPRLIIDLATLTGAIMVALGKEHAGLFANDDKLAAELSAAGEATGEKVWRMPLGKAYDKLIDSKNADMKNIGGRFGGAITAAQFIQRFIKDTPWAHLDVAGTAMDSNRTDISQGWASGWGVRLLDRFVADSYEKAEK
jgi:leucyl aminopeptidase